MNSLPPPAFFRRISFALFSLALVSSAAVAAEVQPPPGFKSLFDGKTFNGWHKVARPPGTTTGDWRIIDGVIVGNRIKGNPEGSYILTDETYGDFELLIDANPAWPADTGILVRNTDRGAEGIQIHCDYRDEGSIGTFYFNGMLPHPAARVRHFGFTAEKDPSGNVTALKYFPNVETEKRGLSYHCPPADFFKAWKVGQWNTIRIRCVGAPLPTITTWINGVKIAEMNTATMGESKPDYDLAAVSRIVRSRGRIGLEVHNVRTLDNPPNWGDTGRCRWRNIFIREL